MMALPSPHSCAPAKDCSSRRPSKSSSLRSRRRAVRTRKPGLVSIIYTIFNHSTSNVGIGLLLTGLMGLGPSPGGECSWGAYSLSREGFRAHSAFLSLQQRRGSRRSSSKSGRSRRSRSTRPGASGLPSQRDQIAPLNSGINSNINSRSNVNSYCCSCSNINIDRSDRSRSSSSSSLTAQLRWWHTSSSPSPSCRPGVSSTRATSRCCPSSDKEQQVRTAALLSTTRLFCSALERDTTWEAIADEVMTEPPSPATAVPRWEEQLGSTSSSSDDAGVEARLGAKQQRKAGQFLKFEGEIPPTTAAARLRRRRQRGTDLGSVEGPTSPGQDVPFTFADLRQATPLPCNIQLVPRVERSSLVYVDGAAKPASRKDPASKSKDLATGKQDFATSDLRRVPASAATEAKSTKPPPRMSSRVASVGGVSSVAVGEAASVVREGFRRDAEGEGVDREERLRRDEAAAVVESLSAFAEGERGKGDAIRLVGEMDISTPAYLQIQEGEDGRSDTLLVSQFGLTRGGAVSRIDLDPNPRLFFGSEGETVGVKTAAAAAAAATAATVANTGLDDILPRQRAQPRLKGTWDGPLLWPNEINLVPPAALIRLIHGKDAEVRYLATKTKNDGSSSKGDNEETEKAKKEMRAPPALRRNERDHIIRILSDKFINREEDIDTIASPPHPKAITTAAEAELEHRLAPDTTMPGHQGVASSKAARSSPSLSLPTMAPARGVPKDEHDFGGGEHTAASPGGWDGPLPEQAVLVADGFLVPGKSDGGVFIVVPAGADSKKKGNTAGNGSGGGRGSDTPTAERIVRLTGAKRGWFYHKAVWVVLPGGKKVVLTARVYKPFFGQAEGELVLLEMPQVASPLSEPNLPWRERVLAAGPDVMFEVVDLDPTDSTVQVICAEFFGGKVTMHSLCGGGVAGVGGGSGGGGSPPSSSPSRPSVVESWVLDHNAGPVYSITAADLRGGSPGGRPTHLLVTTHESSYDYSLFALYSAAASSSRRQESSRVPVEFVSDSENGESNSDYGSDSDSDLEDLESEPGSVEDRQRRQSVSSKKRGGSWVGKRGKGGGGKGGGPAAWGGVVTEGGRERRWERGGNEGGGGGGGSMGGSLVAYEIPEDWRTFPSFYPSPGWRKLTLASGFRVRGISINPGTPGFPYVFHPHKSMEGKRAPYIAVAGDCSQMAYILRPVGSSSPSSSSKGRPPGSGEFPEDPEACASQATTAQKRGNDDDDDGGSDDNDIDNADPSSLLAYEVACAIEVPGTVGSLAVSYGSVLGEGRTRSARARAAPNRGYSSCGGVGVTQQKQQQGVHDTGSFLPEQTEQESGARLASGAAGLARNQTCLPESTPIGGESCGTRFLGGGVGDESVSVDEDGVSGDDDSSCGWAKLFVPNYDGNKVYIFSMEPAR